MYLLLLKGVTDLADVEDVIQKNDRSLDEVFKLFDLIHVITTDHQTVTRITREVVQDFALENVVYLELRTTPKVTQSFCISCYVFFFFFVKYVNFINLITRQRDTKDFD